MNSIPMNTTAIITNIAPLYESMKQKGINIVEFSSFYKVASFSYANSDFLLVKATPGNVIIDIVRILAETCSRILLFGIAGSLCDNLKIGDVVCPTVFSKDGSTPIMLNKISPITLHQTTGLIQSDAYYLDLINNGVALVDMESYDFIYECCKVNIPCSSVLQISDEPLTSPFYTTDYRGLNVEMYLKAGGLL